MATSTCVKCGGTSFENKEFAPKGSNFKLTFIQCSSCGGVVGVMDYWNIGTDIHKQNAVINKIARSMKISSNLDES